ncbi:lipocalin family protein [Lacinutrix chionoecetis]
MKTIIKKNKLVLVLLLLISFSCSKDDDNAEPVPVPEPTAAELLVNKWYLVKQTDHTTTPPTDQMANDCEQNTYYNFLSDGNLIAEGFYLDSGSACVSNGIVAATYILSDDGESLIFTSGTSPSSQVLNVDVLSATEFVISQGDFSITFNK